MTGAAARDTVLIGATGAYAGAFASNESAIAISVDKMKARASRAARFVRECGVSNGLADVDFRSI